MRGIKPSKSKPQGDIAKHIPVIMPTKLSEDTEWHKKHYPYDCTGEKIVGEPDRK